MADIDVVPRKSGSGWVMWVVLALVAVAVLWMFMARGGDQQDAMAVPLQAPLTAATVGVPVT